MKTATGVLTGMSTIKAFAMHNANYRDSELVGGTVAVGPNYLEFY